MTRIFTLLALTLAALASACATTASQSACSESPGSATCLIALQGDDTSQGVLQSHGVHLPGSHGRALHKASTVITVARTGVWFEGKMMAPLTCARRDGTACRPGEPGRVGDVYSLRKSDVGVRKKIKKLETALLSLAKLPKKASTEDASSFAGVTIAADQRITEDVLLHVLATAHAASFTHVGFASLNPARWRTPIALVEMDDIREMMTRPGLIVTVQLSPTKFTFAVLRATANPKKSSPRVGLVEDAQLAPLLKSIDAKRDAPPFHTLYSRLQAIRRALSPKQPGEVAAVLFIDGSDDKQLSASHIVAALDAVSGPLERDAYEDAASYRAAGPKQGQPSPPVGVFAGGSLRQLTANLPRVKARASSPAAMLADLATSTKPCSDLSDYLETQLETKAGTLERACDQGDSTACETWKKLGLWARKSPYLANHANVELCRAVNRDPAKVKQLVARITTPATAPTTLPPTVDLGARFAKALAKLGHTLRDVRPWFRREVAAKELTLINQPLALTLDLPSAGCYGVEGHKLTKLFSGMATVSANKITFLADEIIALAKNSQCATTKKVAALAITLLADVAGQMAWPQVQAGLRKGGCELGDKAACTPLRVKRMKMRKVKTSPVQRRDWLVVAMAADGSTKVDGDPVNADVVEAAIAEHYKQGAMDNKILNRRAPLWTILVPEAKVKTKRVKAMAATVRRLMTTGGPPPAKGTKKAGNTVQPANKGHHEHVLVLVAGPKAGTTRFIVAP